VSPLNAENSSAFPSTRWNAGRRGFCKGGPYGSIFARASLERSRHSRISVVGKVERKWSMLAPPAARFFDTGRMAPDGDLVNADVALFDATEVEGN
jgi:hypothetical protein